MRLEFYACFPVQSLTKVPGSREESLIEYVVHRAKVTRDLPLLLRKTLNPRNTIKMKMMAIIRL